MVAVRNYITEDRTLLSFHKGDIIRLQHMDGLEAGETHENTQNTLAQVPVVDLLSASVSQVRYVRASLCFMPLCVSMCKCVCVCSGKYYGCIVRKKVMLLEELKRDTPEFGGFGRAVYLLSVSECVIGLQFCFLVGLGLFLWLSLTFCVFFI